MRASRPVSPAHDSFTNLHPTCNHPGTHARYAARTMATSQHTSGMTPSVVAFLSDERKPYSRIRSVEEAGAFGLSISWLDPQHFDLLVDERLTWREPRWMRIHRGSLTPGHRTVYTPM